MVANTLLYCIAKTGDVFANVSSWAPRTYIADVLKSINVKAAVGFV